MNPKIIFLLVLFSQAATALNYTSLPELNLTIGSPPYQTVWNYNLERSHDASGSPQGVSLKNGLGYSNAWVKILALDNVILDSETDQVFASRQGRVLTKYEYIPSCPPSDYCWTTCIGDRYELASSNGILSITANGQPIGNNEVSAYSLPDTVSELSLGVGLSIKTGCMKYSLKVITDDYTGEKDCVEEAVGIKTFYGNLADNAAYNLYDLDPQANLTISHIAQDVSEITTGELIIKTSIPYSNLNFSIGNGSIYFSGNAYDVDDYLPDYNLLRVSTYNLPRISKYSLFSNISRSRDNVTGEITTIIDFTLSYAETTNLLKSRDCKLDLEDMFIKKYSFASLCQREWKQAIINVSTNRLIFADKEKINVSVLLNYQGQPIPNKGIIIHYAGANYSKNTDSKGIAEFIIPAKYPYNKIEVEFLGDQDYLGCSKTVLIGIFNSQADSLFAQILPGLLVLIISAYGLYRMIKHLRG